MKKRNVIFAVLFALISIVPLNAYSQTASSGVQEIQVTAKKYEFSPNPIRVKKGQPVKLIVTATDHDHGIQIDAFHIKQKLIKNQPTTIEFTPDKTGSFPFKCSVFCGIHHGSMKGTLIVEE